MSVNGVLPRRWARLIALAVLLGVSLVSATPESDMLAAIAGITNKHASWTSGTNLHLWDGCTGTVGLQTCTWNGRGLTGTVDLTLLPSTLTELYLHTNSLSGTVVLTNLPAAMTILHIHTNSFSGSVTLNNLPGGLTQLLMYSNPFNAALTITSLPNSLVTLQMQACGFTGNNVIPWASLPSSLQTLFINSNSLTGSVALNSLPAGMLEIYAGANQFSGAVTINLPSGFQNLRIDSNPFNAALTITSLPTSLVHLWIQSCGFTGSNVIPWASLPSSLQYLFVHANSLSGSIVLNSLPAGIKELVASNNQFSGAVTMNLPSGMQILKIDNNPFNAALSITSLPNSLLSLYFNNCGFTGSNVVPWASLPSSLQYLVIYSNSLSGTVTLNSLPVGILEIHAYSNSFSGAVTLNLPSGMTHLKIHSNPFNAALVITSLPSSLVQLYLSSCGFTGNNAIPWGTLPASMQYLYVYSNSLTGSMSLNSLPSGIQHILAYSNSFSGTVNLNLPSGMSQLQIQNNPFNAALTITSLPSSLVYLYLGSCGFTGSGIIPWGTLPVSLQYLQVPSNSFTGTVTLNALPSGIKEIHAYSNSFSGAVTLSLPSGMTLLMIHSNPFNAALTITSLPSSLVYLYVGSCGFTGNNVIPWGTLPVSLQYLQVQSNSFTGTVTLNALPSSIKEVIAYSNSYSGAVTLNLPSGMTLLQIHSNPFHAALTIVSLPSSLTNLQLQNCGFTGNNVIPWTTLPASLQYFYVSANSLTGTVVLNSLPGALIDMDIGSNSFSGPVTLNLPAGMATMKMYSNPFNAALTITSLPTSLVSLWLLDCGFTGNNAIPWATLPSSLQYLYVYGNSLTGSVVLDSLPAGMKEINANGNQFTGAVNLNLPVGMTQLQIHNNPFNAALTITSLPSSLVYLYLSSCGFTGNNAIPWGTLPANLQYLLVHTNSLTGTVTLNALPSGIKEVQAYSNSFSGAVTLNLPSGMTQLRIQNNPFNAALTITSLPSSLVGLYLSDCGFTGNNVVPWSTLPTSLQNLYVNGNVLTGTLTLTSLPAGLQRLWANSNGLSGSVSLSSLPSGLFELSIGSNPFNVALPALSSLPSSLLRLWISNGGFSGLNVIPWTLLPSGMLILRVEDNGFTGSVNLTALPVGLQELNVARNAFTGNVSFSSLPSTLTLLTLAGNRLSGSVTLPSSAKVGTLDLAGNLFTGTLRVLARPAANAPPLTFLNVSNNSFSGWLDLRGLPVAFVYSNISASAPNGWTCVAMGSNSHLAASVLFPTVGGCRTPSISMTAGEATMTRTATVTVSTTTTGRMKVKSRSPSASSLSILISVSRPSLSLTLSVAVPCSRAAASTIFLPYRFSTCCTYAPGVNKSIPISTCYAARDGCLLRHGDSRLRNDSRTFDLSVSGNPPANVRSLCDAYSTCVKDFLQCVAATFTDLDAASPCDVWSGSVRDLALEIGFGYTGGVASECNRAVDQLSKSLQCDTAVTRPWAADAICAAATERVAAAGKSLVATTSGNGGDSPPATGPKPAVDAFDYFMDATACKVCWEPAIGTADCSCDGHRYRNSTMYLAHGSFALPDSSKCARSPVAFTICTGLAASLDRVVSMRIVGPPSPGFFVPSTAKNTTMTGGNATSRHRWRELDSVAPIGVTNNGSTCPSTHREFFFLLLTAPDKRSSFRPSNVSFCVPLGQSVFLRNPRLGTCDTASGACAACDDAASVTRTAGVAFYNRTTRDVTAGELVFCMSVETAQIDIPTTTVGTVTAVTSGIIDGGGSGTTLQAVSLLTQISCGNAKGSRASRTANPTTPLAIGSGELRFWLGSCVLLFGPVVLHALAWVVKWLLVRRSTPTPPLPLVAPETVAGPTVAAKTEQPVELSPVMKFDRSASYALEEDAAPAEPRAADATPLTSTASGSAAPMALPEAALSPWLAAMKAVRFPNWSIVAVLFSFQGLSYESLALVCTWGSLTATEQAVASTGVFLCVGVGAALIGASVIIRSRMHVSIQPREASATNETAPKAAEAAAVPLGITGSTLAYLPFTHVRQRWSAAPFRLVIPTGYWNPTATLGYTLGTIFGASDDRYVVVTVLVNVLRTVAVSIIVAVTLVVPPFACTIAMYVMSALFFLAALWSLLAQPFRFLVSNMGNAFMCVVAGVVALKVGMPSIAVDVGTLTAVVLFGTIAFNVIALLLSVLEKCVFIKQENDTQRVKDIELMPRRTTADIVSSATDEVPMPSPNKPTAQEASRSPKKAETAPPAANGGRPSSAASPNDVELVSSSGTDDLELDEFILGVEAVVGAMQRSGTAVPPRINSHAQQQPSWIAKRDKLVIFDA